MKWLTHEHMKDHWFETMRIQSIKKYTVVFFVFLQRPIILKKQLAFNEVIMYNIKNVYKKYVKIKPQKIFCFLVTLFVCYDKA